MSLVESGAFTVINSELTFLGSGLTESDDVDEWYRFDVFLFFSNTNLSLFSSVGSEELKTSFHPLCIQLSCELFVVLTDTVLCFCFGLA